MRDHWFPTQSLAHRHSRKACWTELTCPSGAHQDRASAMVGVSFKLPLLHPPSQDANSSMSLQSSSLFLSPARTLARDTSIVHMNVCPTFSPASLLLGRPLLLNSPNSSWRSIPNTYLTISLSAYHSSFSTQNIKIEQGQEVSISDPADLTGNVPTSPTTLWTRSHFRPLAT